MDFDIGKESSLTEKNREKLTRILSAASRGDRAAAARLWECVYEDLHLLALSKMAQSPPGQTLQTTALVHETYLRLIKNKKSGWESRAHFFGAAAHAMRNVLVDHYRMKCRTKRGRGRTRVPLEQISTSSKSHPVDLIALDEALKLLEEKDPRLAKVALLRFFAGLTIEETASTMNISTSTVERDWSYAQAWLYRKMKHRRSG